MTPYIRLHVAQSAAKRAHSTDIDRPGFVLALDDDEKLVLGHSGPNCHIELPLYLRLVAYDLVVQRDYSVLGSKLRGN